MQPIPFFVRDDSRYPQDLRTIFDPPDELHYRASDDSVLATLLSRPLIGIVGTRKMTSYGKRVIRELVPPLVRSGCTIVSGLAFGCDAEAHQATLDAGGGTIAVLAGGIDDASISPHSHLALARRIIEQRGALLTEVPAGSPSFKGAFPKRNRIIAGMCRAIIVVEAEIKSGSMITGRLAAEYGREVFALPGPIHAPYSAGTNHLIQNGAHLLSGANDILERLALSPASALSPLPDLPLPADFDTLLLTTKLSASELFQTLTELELQGHIYNEDGRWQFAQK